jgi:hypothetical protein
MTKGSDPDPLAQHCFLCSILAISRYVNKLQANGKCKKMLHRRFDAVTSNLKQNIVSASVLCHKRDTFFTFFNRNKSKQVPVLLDKVEINFVLINKIAGK